MKAIEAQILELEHIRDMITHNQELIKRLCDSEKDDIVYGFALGEINQHFWELRTDLSKVIDNMNEINEN